MNRENKIFEEAYEQAVKKIQRNRERIGVSFPHAVGEDGNYNREPASFWTGGFWGGLLWLAYRAVGDKALFETACEIEEAQDEPLDFFMELHHDVGFMWMPTAVMHYKTSGCERSRIRGLKAASILAGRFNIKGNFIRSWNDDVRAESQGLTIIDCMMNLPLLYWAGRELRDSRYIHIARAHADMVLQYFVRSDNTVPHIIQFDSETGEYLGTVEGQGKSPDSVWSRGQAWAIYGLAVSYRETGKGAYLDAAKRIARHFYENLPDDYLPLWDFFSEEKDRFAKDSTASCIAASGMLEIAGVEKEGEEKEYFTDCAKMLLIHLLDRCVSFDDSTQGIVGMGTVSYTHGKHVNVPIIYGDFFFVEALGKLQGLPGIF